MGSSREALKQFPDQVRRDVGFALHVAQTGGKANSARVMHGFGGASVLEVVEDHQTDTYRAVYTVRFRSAVYVLHTFKKKSKQGNETPRPDMALIKSRLADAQADYESRQG